MVLPFASIGSDPEQDYFVDGVTESLTTDSSRWQYQVRFNVDDSATAESLRRQRRDAALARLFDVLAAHRAALKCQFDAYSSQTPYRLIGLRSAISL